MPVKLKHKEEGMELEDSGEDDRPQEVMLLSGISGGGGRVRAF